MLKKQVIGERGGLGYGAVITQPFICIVCIREKLDDKIEQRSLSREQHGSNNWEKQRLNVAECHQRIRRKRHDFLHKLSNYYATKYDLVAVEDLIVKSILESAGNSQNTASAAWDTFTTMLEYKCKREGTHFVEVEPAGTIKERASCGVESDKPSGCANTHALPAGSRWIEMQIPQSTFCRVVLRNEDWDSSETQRLWRLRSLYSLHRALPTSWMYSASWKQEAPPSQKPR